jgi:cholesterol oxidase
MAKPRAVVIGTGFGGAVTACRLAQAGFEVDVLERGRRYDQEGLPAGSLDKRWIWQTGLGPYDLRPFTGMQIAQGAGYGGGSLIYANVQLRAQADVFAQGWPPGYSRSELDPYYDLVAYMLDPQPITAASALPLKTRRVAEAARALGRGEQLVYPPLAINFSGDATPRPNRFGVPQTGCIPTGDGGLACPPSARNTLDRNYLARAEQSGARMRTLCDVQLIERRLDGPRPYYRVHYLDYSAEDRLGSRPVHRPSSGDRAEDLLDRRDRLPERGPLEHLDAEHVFLCAGAVNSTELLLRSRQGLPGLSQRLGEGYSGNGDLLAFVFDTREPFAPDLGPTITTALVYKRDGHWFLVEEGGFPPAFWPLVRAMRSAGTWPESGQRDIARGAARVPPASLPELAALLDEQLAVEGANRMRDVNPPEKMKKTGVFLAQGRDLAGGRIELLGGDILHIRWDIEPNLGLYQTEERLCADLASALGGRFGENALWRQLHIPISVHSLGGCPMGADAAHGVTSDIGEVFGHENLFVLDGAILPASTGVNPSHTIAAVVERNIERIIRRVTGDRDWVAPERPLAKPVPDPLAAVSTERIAPPTTPAPGLSLRMAMKGAWTGTEGRRGPVRFEGEILVVDVQRFLEDPTHSAVVRGSLDVAGLTDGRAPVRHGVSNLFFEPDGGAERKIRYVLPFLDEHDFPHVIDMRTTLRSPLFRGRLRELTTLDVAIHLTDDPQGGPLVGNGTMGFGLVEILRAALSIRFIGPYGLPERLRVAARMLRFLLVRAAKGGRRSEAGQAG